MNTSFVTLEQIRVTGLAALLAPIPRHLFTKTKLVTATNYT